MATEEIEKIEEIEEKLLRIKDNIAESYTALEEKGAEIPDVRNSANIARSILTIPNDDEDEALFKGFIERTLTEIKLPDNIVKIRDHGFRENTIITSIDSPNVTEIGKYAFYYCSALESVYMPNVTSIGNYAFYYCSALVSIDLSNVTEIGEYGFRDAALVSADMPKVTYIGKDAFYGCTALKKAFIPSTCETINPESGAYSNSPFYGCSSLTIYTDVPSADDVPEGWARYWNYIASDTQAPVVWGCSHDEFVNA